MSGVHTRKASVRCKACGRSHRPVEAHMKKRTARLVAASIAVVLVALGAHALSAQPAAFKRTVLRKADLSTPGREVVQALVEIPGGVRPGKHTHPGEEIGYVLDGTLVVWVEGRPAVTVKAGDSFFVEAGRPHETTNEGTTVAKILATYMVEKGKPLATPLPY
ncbi:MAG: cupin domain-containing protein [Candidatus Rokuibacteriota bacterium]|nr:MAG: cupin domain-containing protein [Candidatus Rokubacteria bacterium]